MRLVFFFTFVVYLLQPCALGQLPERVGPHRARVYITDHSRRHVQLDYQIPADAERTEFTIFRGETLEDARTQTLCFTSTQHQIRLADLGGWFRFRITSWDARGIPRYETDWEDGLGEFEFPPPDIEVPETEPYPALDVRVDGSVVFLTLHNVDAFDGDPPRPKWRHTVWEWVDGVSRLQLPEGTHDIAVGPATITVTIESAVSYVGWYSSVGQEDLSFSTTINVATGWEPREVIARLFTSSGVREAFLRVDDYIRPGAQGWIDPFPGASGILVLEPQTGGGAIRATAAISNTLSANVAAIRSRPVDDPVTALVTADSGTFFIAAANPTLDWVDVSVVVDGMVVHVEPVPPRSLWRSLDVLSDLDGSHHIEVRGAPSWVGLVNGHEVVSP